MRSFFRKLTESILTYCAKITLWRYSPYIIAITGSAGKTTTKYTVGEVLKSGLGTDRVRVGFGNLSTVSGVPLAILDIQTIDLNPLSWLIILPWAIIKTVYIFLSFSFPHYLVLEVAADRPGDIEKIAKYLHPSVSVVTNVGPSHLQYFKNIQNVGQEKSALVKNTSRSGLVILNKNDDEVNLMAKLTTAEVIYLNCSSSDFAIESAKIIGKKLDINENKLKTGIRSVKLPSGRFDLLTGKKDTLIIDSSYNANPVSVRDALLQLAKVAGSRRKIIVLGDMLELGSQSIKYHQEIGRLARLTGDYLMAIGKYSSVMPADFKTLNLKEAIDHLLSIIQTGDTILIKASHGMHLEQVVSALKG